MLFSRVFSLQGVIFSIAFNASKQLICSASDDRSVRVWEVFTTTNINQSDDRSLLSRISADDSEIRLQHTLYGHSARVWDVRMLRDVIISVGEVVQDFKRLTSHGLFCFVKIQWSPVIVFLGLHLLCLVIQWKCVGENCWTQGFINARYISSKI